MTLEEVKALNEHYKNVLADSKKEVERLKAEIEESKSVIRESKADAKKAARAADQKAYNAARNRVDMHSDRIRQHEVTIIDLEHGHLIDDEEYKEIMTEMRNLQNRRRNETAAAFMKCIKDLEKLVADYREEMRPCNALGKLLQEEVYREYDRINPDRIAYYSDTNSAKDTFTRVVRSLGENEGANFGCIERWAANVLKAEAASNAGLPEKAKEVLESD